MMAKVQSVLEWLGAGSLLEVVQSVIALTLTVTLVYMVVVGQPLSDSILTIYAAVISFYFGSRSTRSRENGA